MTTALLAAPFLWVFLEYIRSNLSFLSLPWGLLAHSQYQYLPVIQVASLSGAYGISFLIVMVNSAITAIVYPVFWRLGKTHLGSNRLPSNKGKMVLAITASLLMGLVLFHGHIKVSKPIVGQGIKVSVVQGNIEQPKKWDPKYARFIMQTYAELTQKGSEEQPALIIWPETATPWSINQDPLLYAQIRRIAKTAGAYLLLGSAQPHKFRLANSKEIKYLNSAFLVPPEVEISRNQRYDKIHLLPFGEYLPYREIIPWSYIKVPDVGSYMPGEEFTIFRHPSFRFGVTICWEDIFPELVRRLVKGGAQFIINITNEAWFGRTAAPYQFVSMSVFRAVENRLYVLRCANTGVSCFIDPYGRVIDRVIDNRGQDIFVRGVLTRSIVPMESKTIYTRYGDWFVWLCFACSTVFLILAIFRIKSVPQEAISIDE